VSNFDPIPRLQQIAATIEESGADIFDAPATAVHYIECAIKEIERLRKERDEARRMACEMEERLGCDDSGCPKNGLAHDHAKRRGEVITTTNTGDTPMTDFDIVAGLRSRSAWFKREDIAEVLENAANEIDRLNDKVSFVCGDLALQEIARLRKERDEVRQSYCSLMEAYRGGDGRVTANKLGWGYLFEEDKPCQ
jgi:hypothetical protein